MRRVLLLTPLLLLLADCFVQKPTAGNKSGAATIVHADFTATNTCETCHEVDRPAAVGTVAHGGGQDCGTCHTPQDNNSGWLTFNHVPKPTACSSCHAFERPGGSHPQTGDCVLCHIYTPNAFQPGTSG